jgi:molybdenum cofactor synthesis domain-containing protein
MKGTPKQPKQACLFKEGWGIEGDAHAGKWHRQVSLLSSEAVQAFVTATGIKVKQGEFGENLLVAGMDFPLFPIGTVFVSGDVVLRLTQIGKKCHDGCTIKQRTGKCIMPTQGVFARVLHGGEITPRMELKAYTNPRVAIICASDKGYEGKRIDESTPLLKQMVNDHGYETVMTILLPDERKMLAEKMASICDGFQSDVILTTGGTGLSFRDVTPEATEDVADRLVPGLAELMRWKSFAKTSRASLSRAVCATRKQTLIINLPGSPRGAAECLEAVLEPLAHGLAILQGTVEDCAADRTD